MFKINSNDFSVSRLKKELLKNCQSKFDIPSLIRYIGILTDTIASFKTISSQRVLCECALIKLTSPQVNTDFESLLSRIDSLENKISALENGSFVPKVQKSSKVSVAQQGDALAQTKEPAKEVSSQSDASTNNLSSSPKSDLENDFSHLSKAVSNWADIMKVISTKGCLRVYTALFGTTPFVSDDKLVINVTDEDKNRLLSDKANISLIKECIKEAVDVDADVEITKDIINNTSRDDIFSDLENIGKKFPSNFKIDWHTC